MLEKCSEDSERILQYTRREDQLLALASSLMIKRICRNAQVIRKDATGRGIKPCCSNGPMFNVSHDEEFAVCMHAIGFSVGIDIMKVQVSQGNNGSLEKMFDTLTPIFSHAEWAFILDDKPLDRFYYLWTAKEAYVKCIGTGLYTEPQDLETFDYCMTENHVEMKIRHANVPACNFSITVYTAMIPGYVVGICTGPIAECDPSWTRFVQPCTNTQAPHCNFSPSHVVLTVDDLL